jgi:hypothetical protein
MAAKRQPPPHCCEGAEAAESENQTTTGGSADGVLPRTPPSSVDRRRVKHPRVKHENNVLGLLRHGNRRTLEILPADSPRVRPTLAPVNLPPADEEDWR